MKRGKDDGYFSGQKEFPVYAVYKKQHVSDEGGLTGRPFSHVLWKKNREYGFFIPNPEQRPWIFRKSL